VITSVTLVSLQEFYGPDEGSLFLGIIHLKSCVLKSGNCVATFRIEPQLPMPAFLIAGSRLVNSEIYCLASWYHLPCPDHQFGNSLV